MNKKTYLLKNLEVEMAEHEDKPYKLADGDGLYLHVMENGSKLWRFRYRYAGKEKMLSLGKYPEISLSDARTSRDAAKELLLRDIDPSEMRKQEKARDKAEQLEAARIPSVRASFDGNIEIWKGSNIMRLTLDEARFVGSLLTNLTTR